MPRSAESTPRACIRNESTHSASLHVDGDGRLIRKSIGNFTWLVHRYRNPVAFLTSPLVGLGTSEGLSVQVVARAAAVVTVTTQGPTLLLRTERAVRRRWSFEVVGQSHVTYLPWVALPFPGARASFDVCVRVSAGSSFVGWDTMSIGRIARGERFLFDDLRWTMDVRGPDGGRLQERSRILRSDGLWASEALGSWTHLGNLLIVGIRDGALSADEVERLLRGRVDLSGVSRPAPDLLLVRALDRSSERLELAFWPIVNLARRAIGVHPVLPEHVARRWFG